MACGPAASTTPKSAWTAAQRDPFAFGDTKSMVEGARAMSLFWTIPLRTFMVVMGEATRGKGTGPR